MAHVLLVEDEPDTRETLAALIAAKGIDVVTASNGHDALAKLSSEGVPCLILLDLLLPGMNGWELRVELLAHAEYANVPVILLSGLSDVEQHARILRAIDYLGKPVDLDKLYRLLETHCSQAA